MEENIQTENTKAQSSVQPINTEEEVQIAKTASSRRSFFIHLSIFVLSCLLIWVIWYLLHNIVKEEYTSGMFKICLGISLVWLIIIIFHYLISFRWTRTHTEKEISRLRRKRDKQMEEIKSLKDEIHQNDTSIQEEKNNGNA